MDLIKKTALFVCTFLSVHIAAAQIDFSTRYRELYDKYNQNKNLIPPDELYGYAGIIKQYNTYLVATEQVNRKRPVAKKPRFTFINGPLLKVGGWICMKLSLENNTAKTIKLDNKYLTDDVTRNEIRQVKEYIGDGKKWYELSKVLGDCGGGYFEGRLLKPGQRAILAVSVSSLNEGDTKAFFKVSILINDQWIDSDSMEIRMYENQLKKLQQESKSN